MSKTREQIEKEYNQLYKELIEKQKALWDKWFELQETK